MHVKPPPHWIHEVVKYSKEGVFCTYSESYVEAGSTTGAVMLDIQYLQKYRADLYKKILKNDQSKRRGGISKVYFNGELDTTEIDILLNIQCLLSNIPDAYKENLQIGHALSILNDHLKNVDVDLPCIHSSRKRKRETTEYHMMHMFPPTCHLGDPANPTGGDNLQCCGVRPAQIKTNGCALFPSCTDTSMGHSEDLGHMVPLIAGHTPGNEKPDPLTSPGHNSEDLESMVLPSTDLDSLVLQSQHRDVEDLGTMALCRASMDSGDLESMLLSTISQGSDNSECGVLPNTDLGVKPDQDSFAVSGSSSTMIIQKGTSKGDLECTNCSLHESPVQFEMPADDGLMHILQGLDECFTSTYE